MYLLHDPDDIVQVFQDPITMDDIKLVVWKGVGEPVEVVDDIGV